MASVTTENYKYKVSGNRELCKKGHYIKNYTYRKDNTTNSVCAGDGIWNCVRRGGATRRWFGRGGSIVPLTLSSFYADFRYCCTVFVEEPSRHAHAELGAGSPVGVGERLPQVPAPGTERAGEATERAENTRRASRFLCV